MQIDKLPTPPVLSDMKLNDQKFIAEVHNNVDNVVASFRLIGCNIPEGSQREREIEGILLGAFANAMIKHYEPAR